MIGTCIKNLILVLAVFAASPIGGQEFKRLPAESPIRRADYRQSNSPSGLQTKLKPVVFHRQPRMGSHSSGTPTRGRKTSNALPVNPELKKGKRNEQDQIASPTVGLLESSSKDELIVDYFAESERDSFQLSTVLDRFEPMQSWTFQVANREPDGEELLSAYKVGWSAMAMSVRLRWEGWPCRRFRQDSRYGGPIKWVCHWGYPRAYGSIH